jgi:formiminotetrahydrofolate cyclodeaminase
VRKEEVDLSGLTLAQWTAALSERAPVPAGGALACVTAAGAAALASKVARLRGFSSLQLSELARSFLRAAEEDGENYAKAVTLGGEAKDACLDADREHLERAVEFLENLAELFPDLPSPLAADVAAAGRLGRAAARTLLVNLAVNASQWSERSAAGAIAEKLEELKARLEAV